MTSPLASGRSESCACGHPDDLDVSHGPQFCHWPICNPHGQDCRCGSCTPFGLRVAPTPPLRLDTP